MEISMEQPVFLVFLRHFGCIFCQKALIDLAERQDKLKQKNMQLVLVHMAEAELAKNYFNKFGVQNEESISDPDCEIYHKFGLAKGNFNQLFGLKSWAKGFELFVTTSARGSIKSIGDGFQMPGIFIIHKGEIVEQYIHKFSSDEPDYDSMMECCNDSVLQ